MPSGSRTISAMRLPRRYTLRSALVLVTILGAFLGWWANRALTQRQAVAAIFEHGGQVCYAESRFPAFATWLGKDFTTRVTSVAIFQWDEREGAVRWVLADMQDMEALRSPLRKLPHLQSVQVLFNQKDEVRWLKLHFPHLRIHVIGGII